MPESGGIERNPAHGLQRPQGDPLPRDLTNYSICGIIKLSRQVDQEVPMIQETDDQRADRENDELRAPHEARNMLSLRDQWIEDELHRLNVEMAEVRKIKLRKGQPIIYFVNAAEVLKAVEQRVADRTEARKILGLSRRRQPPTLAAAAKARAAVRKVRGT